MAFKKCHKCGKLTREVDMRCWNCGGTSFGAERVSGSSGSSQPEESTRSQVTVQGEEPARCPRCGSTQLAANKKGFGLGKAVAGGVLTGGIGLLAGFIGSGKVLVTCIKCGKQWKAGS